MKIGSKVVVIRMDQDGEWQVPDDAFAGTLIAIEHDGDMDGGPADQTQNNSPCVMRAGWAPQGADPELGRASTPTHVWALQLWPQ